MPRLLRPTRRTILTASLLLLAGAVVNVAVAWVLVGAPESWTGRPVTVFSQGLFNKGAPPSKQRLQQVAAHLDSLAPPDDLSTIFIYRGVGWTVTGAHALNDQSQRWAGRRVDAGWPLRSMTFIAADTDWTTLPNPYSEGDWFAGPRDRLPLTPIPAGFAINTLFYAAILALPLSFFPIRRRLRARRGRCPKCGYDLAGLGDAGGPCPECGGTQ